MKQAIGIVLGAFAALVVPWMMIEGELGSAVSGPLLLHGAFFIALTFVLCVLVFAALVPSVVKGRALHAPALFAAAVAPFLVTVLTFAGRHHRDHAALLARGVSASTARDFAFRSSQSEALLAIGALVTASALVVAGSMGIGLQITSKLKGTLALLAFASSALFFSVYEYALAKREALLALLAQAMPPADRVQSFADTSSAMTTSLVFGVLFAIAIVLVVGLQARRAPGLGTWLGASVAMLGLVLTPWILARGDYDPFEVPDPGLVGDIQIPTTHVGWDDARAHHQKIVVSHTRGTQELTGPGGDDAIDLVIDNAVPFGFLNIVVSNLRGRAFALYAAPPTENRADVSELGALGTFIDRRTTSVDVHFTDAADDTNRVVIVDDDFSRVNRNLNEEAVLLMGTAPGIGDMRRDAFKQIHDLSESPLYIAPRDTDTLATIWQIAEAARAATGGALHIVLTTDRRTAAERKAARQNPSDERDAYGAHSAR